MTVYWASLSRYFNHSACSPSVATKARWAARSSSLTRGVSAPVAGARPPHPIDHVALAADVLGEAKLSLAAADQLEINLGQDFGVEQRPMLGAPRIVDVIARAQRVEIIGPGRMLAPRQHQRIDQPLARDQRAFDALELSAQKAVVEAGVAEARRRQPGRRR